MESKIWNVEPSRLSYIDRMMKGLVRKPNSLLPSASEENSFEEALSNLVLVFTGEKYINSVAPFREMKDTELRCGTKDCSTKSKLCRKRSLKEILRTLKSIERKRSYDPPANNEIRYYLLIKKYMRSMLAFFTDRRSCPEVIGTYECYAYSNTLHEVDELVELNRHLADFASFVSEIDITNVSAIKSLMGIQDNYEVEPIIHGSKERSYRFYWHKFKLAYHDIRSSEHGSLPPYREEKISYLRALDHFSSLSSVKDEEKPNVYSEEVYMVFLEKVEREIRDLERHSLRIRKSILEKLSMNEPWESLVESYDNHVGTDIIEDDDVLMELERILAEKCRVSKDDLPVYIDRLNRCRDIAHTTASLLCRLSFNREDLCRPTVDTQALIDFGWDALHALTLFKCGSFSPRNVFRGHVILRNPEKNGPRKHEREREEENVNEAAEDADHEEENVNILQGIVEDLRRIGDSDAPTDKDEKTLMYKIWLSAASSVHFFFSAMAYEQQRYIISCGSSAEGGAEKIVKKTIKMMTRKKKNSSTTSANVTELRHESEVKATLICELAYNVQNDMSILWAVLHAYARGLYETLGVKLERNNVLE